ncbi:dihydrolipoamide dehydrogenase [Desemzia sp. RIT804]|uniref:dihydrolipoamide dehydrogenase n=1 Tax=Desemzia sp. RIT 804 TaxID=2810209 RepID=UPI00194DEFC6|nr:dihydrolipoamide dehydrogenase [Desemzia sp. RIT 804]MBM6615918.1 dihydrolipoamide dehydrogenase [Desemzia sp. RIT 804]
MEKVKRPSYPRTWIGLKPTRFKKYQKWINRDKPGICGTYVSAALLHDTFLRYYEIDLDKENLLLGLKTIVDERFPYRGTFPWDLKLGLGYVVGDIAELSVKMSLIPETTVIDLLNRANPVPVAVGTAKLFGSKYKNHWLLVYAYGYNKEGKLYFKAYDNHGKYSAIVPASQTIGCVWIEKKNENS